MHEKEYNQHRRSKQQWQITPLLTYKLCLYFTVTFVAYVIMNLFREFSVADNFQRQGVNKFF